MSEDCTCKECRSYCEYKPGWFAPGEAEKVAEFLGLSLQELFERYLVVDYWERLGAPNIFNLSPASDRNVPGAVDHRDSPLGRCVFFENDLCKIHPVKPLECRLAHHTSPIDEVRARHERVGRLWDTPEHQARIKGLLGEE